MDGPSHLWAVVDFLREERIRHFYLAYVMSHADAMPDEVRAAIADIDRSRRGFPTRYKKPGAGPGKD
ncbi:hypothetical protein [Caballeronia sp. INML2]|uniref:hypothetical protein n=1 Tax=Caballeronia sp. INML2 TaxID=2921748 RepID=UPI002028FA9C|nr:hypothetical protein [Caballeronia sp. INML2]